MRIDSRLPDDTVNVSEGSVVREVALLVIGVAGAVIGITALLALSVEALVPLVPPSLEVRFFSVIAETVASVDEDDEESTDRDLRTDQVQGIIDRLAVHWVDSPYESFHAFVLDDPLPNAFALPGGAIGVTSGLLDRIETENELAFVLGHELGHFAGRDHLRGIGRGLAITIAWGAFGLSGDQIESLASTASALSARHFDRDQESDADLVGTRLVVAEYGHAAGASAVFERVLVDPDGVAEEAKAPGSLERLSSYLATHPLGPDRIDALETFITESGWSSEGAQTAWIPRDPPEVSENR